MITRALAGAAIILGAAVGVASPAIADPDPFGGIDCPCQPANEKVGAPMPSPDQTTPAIQQGFAALQANQAQQ